MPSVFNFSFFIFNFSTISSYLPGWSGATPCAFFHSPIRLLTSIRAAMVSHNASSSSSISARNQFNSMLSTLFLVSTSLVSTLSLISLSPSFFAAWDASKHVNESKTSRKRVVNESRYFPNVIGVICCTLSESASSGRQCTSIIAPSSPNSGIFCINSGTLLASPLM